MPQLTIRPMTPADTDRVSELVVAAYTGDYELTGDYAASLGRTAERAETSDIYVAELDGRIVGTVTLGRNGEPQLADTKPHEQDFRLLAVDPSVRRQGIARKLIEFVEEVGRRRGMTTVFLHTGPDMIGAQRLYEALGFTRDLSRGEWVDEGRLQLWTYHRPIAAAPITAVAPS